MRKKFLSAFVSCLVAGNGMALTVVDDDTNSLNIGGYLSIATQSKDSKTTVQNDSARINFGLEHKLSESMEGYALIEWGYKARNEYSNDNGATKAADVFSNRRAYIGVKHSEWGAIAFGKQRSVYGDVARWTEKYVIGGSQAMGMYSGINADGGFSGTGRADDAFTYRINFGGLKIGAQYQLHGTNYVDDPRGNKVLGDVKRNHGYQMAVSYTFDMGISLGVAYNEVSLEAYLQGPTASDSRDINSRAVTAGINYINNDLYLAATFGQFQDHTSAHLGYYGSARGDQDNFGLDKKSEGIELYGRYKLSKLLDGGISLQAGWNQLMVKEDNSNAADNSSDAKLDKTMFGALYEIGRLEFGAEYFFNSSKVYYATTNNVKQYKGADDYFMLRASYYL